MILADTQRQISEADIRRSHCKHAERFDYMTLISYSTKTFTDDSTGSQSVWLRNFRHVTGNLVIMSQEMASMLYLVSSSIINQQSLPPYLKLPRPFDLAERM
jgi:hypothetical protein